ncbi:MAG: hypothetical protein GY795_06365 [Desulfobacterales bacterium]|nr:hypothetical protein [Desulfobacterales bacterium]
MNKESQKPGMIQFVLFQHVKQIEKSRKNIMKKPSETDWDADEPDLARGLRNA